MATMIDGQIAQMRTHRNNIHRYRRLLSTKLTELERQFIETRMAEEQSKLESLTSSTFPLAFKLPYQPSEVAAANDAPPG
jgi:hypothetical protein